MSPHHPTLSEVSCIVPRVIWIWCGERTHRNRITTAGYFRNSDRVDGPESDSSGVTEPYRLCSSASPEIRAIRSSLKKKGSKMADETNNNLTPEQMAARIAELEGRLAKGSRLSFKVSEKGGVSV